MMMNFDESDEAEGFLGDKKKGITLPTIKIVGDTASGESDKPMGIEISKVGVLGEQGMGDDMRKAIARMLEALEMGEMSSEY